MFCKERKKKGGKKRERKKKSSGGTTFGVRARRSEPSGRFSCARKKTLLHRASAHIRLPTIRTHSPLRLLDLTAIVFTQVTLIPYFILTLSKRYRAIPFFKPLLTASTIFNFSKSPFIFQSLILCFIINAWAKKLH